MATIDRIVVPLDGSEIAETALPLATTLARALGVDMELVHVHGVTYGGEDDAVETEVVDAARKYLDEKGAALESEAGVSSRRTLLEGVVASELAKHLEGSGRGIVVMTTHGRSGLSRLWLGSTAETLVRTSPWPVLLIRPDEEQEAPQTMDRIVVGLDGSDRAEQTLPWARAIAAGVNGRITLFQAVGDESAAEEAEAYLRGLAAEGEEVAIATSGSAGRALLEQAGDLSANLVALSTRGRGPVTRTLFGSVADKVIRAAETPLLVVNGDGES